MTLRLHFCEIFMSASVAPVCRLRLAVTQWNPVAGVGQAFSWITAVITDEWNARFLILISLLGSVFWFLAGASPPATPVGSRFEYTRTRDPAAAAVVMPQHR